MRHADAYTPRRSAPWGWLALYMAASGWTVALGLWIYAVTSGPC